MIIHTYTAERLIVVFMGVQHCQLVSATYSIIVPLFCRM